MDWIQHISLTIQLKVEPVAIETRSLRSKSTQSLDMAPFLRDVSMNRTASPL